MVPAGEEADVDDGRVLGEKRAEVGGQALAKALQIGIATWKNRISVSKDRFGWSIKVFLNFFYLFF